MTLWTEEFYTVAEEKLSQVYDHKWWSPDFAAAHPKVTFLMQVLNRHIVSPSNDYAEQLREQIAKQDEGADYALGRNHWQIWHIDMAKLAFTALVLEERALGFRFALSAVMTAEDNHDLALLLNGINEDRSHSARIL